MRMMGLPGYMNWLAWLTTAMLTCLVINLLILLLLCTNFGKGAVVPEGDPSAVLVYFMLYCLSLVAFMFMLSTFFNNRKRKDNHAT